MNHQPLTGRERVRLALRHETADRIPIAMVCAGINPPALRDLEQYLARERGSTAADYLEPLVDIVEVAPPYRGPGLAERTDVWGVRRRAVSYGAGSYDEIERYPLAGGGKRRRDRRAPWPDPDWFDYECLRGAHRRARANGDPCLMIVERQHLRDLLVHARPGADARRRHGRRGAVRRDHGAGHGLLRRVLRQGPRGRAAGTIDLVFTADDIGDQRGPILLPKDRWRRLIAPHHPRLNGVIHAHGAKVIYHTDGSVMWAPSTA